MAFDAGITSVTRGGIAMSNPHLLIVEHIHQQFFFQETTFFQE
jgi:hypothetical protein